jgi:hypothetical protein
MGLITPKDIPIKMIETKNSLKEAALGGNNVHRRYVNIGKYTALRTAIISISNNFILSAYTFCSYSLILLIYKN